MTSTDQRQKAFDAFDAYNANDPHEETWEGKVYPKELLYARRMSEQLNAFAPDVPEYLHLAARCQHIGRWEIPRDTFPMDRTGYLKWRNTLKTHHGTIAEKILNACGYDANMIAIVKFLLEKKDLKRNPDTQLLEDVICLVFVRFYLEEFASRHDDEKVTDILTKTMKKMSRRALESAGTIAMSPRIGTLVGKAAAALEN